MCENYRLEEENKQLKMQISALTPPNKRDYTPKNSKEAFSTELDLLENANVKKLVDAVLDKAPSYFWEIPGSVSGKYHPLDELGVGGKALHTKKAFYLGVQLCKMDNIEGYRKDMLLGSLLCHDICCQGKDNEALPYTDKDHPYYVREITEELKELPGYDIMMDIVEGHMGRWSPRDMVFIDNYDLVRLGHVADYLSSKREFTIPILEQEEK